MTKFLLLALPFSFVCLGCGSGGNDSPTPPPDPPTLRLEGFRNLDGFEADSEATCIELGTDSEGTLLVDLVGSSATTIGEWSLRPPRTCGSTAACGHLQARLDPEADSYALQATSANTTVMLSFANPCPQTASASECVPLDDPTGEHTLEILLRDDDGFAVLDSNDEPTRITVDFTLTDPDGC